MSSVNASSGKLSKEVVSVPHIDSAGAKKAVRIFLITSLLLATLQVVLNWTLNPTGELREGGVLLPSVTDSDAYRKIELFDDFVEKADGRPIGIIMGSSRSMMLSFQDEAAGDPVQYFNLGISGGMGEDIYALTNYVLSRTDANVVDVVLALDYVTLGTPGDGGYGERVRGVHSIAEPIREEIALSPTERMNGLLSLDWARAAIGSTQPPADLGFNDCGARSDEEYSARVERSREGRDVYRQNHISLILRSLPSTPELDERRIADVEAAVNLWVENGTSVTFLMPPFQSDLLDGLRGEKIFQERHAATKDVLEALTDDERVRLVDLTDPELSGVTSNDYWWDGYHYSAAGATEIANHLGYRPSDADMCAGTGD